MQKVINHFHVIMQYTNANTSTYLRFKITDNEKYPSVVELNTINSQVSQGQVCLFYLLFNPYIINDLNTPYIIVLETIAVIVRLALVFAGHRSNTDPHLKSHIPLVNNLRKQANKETIPQVITIEINIEMTEPRGLGDNPNQSQLHPLYQFSFPSQSCPIQPYVFKQPIRQKYIIHFSPQCSNYALQQRCSTQLNTSATFKSLQQNTQENHKTMINKTNKQNIYKMTSKPRGIAIIINNKNFVSQLTLRSGSTVDVHNLWDLFNYLGFNPQYHHNKTHTEMRQILNDIAGMDHDKYDCLMVAILTHGNYGDVLYGTTGVITIQEVIEIFSSKRCPTLIGKPKIFIIQACRGTRLNQAVELNDTNSEECDMIDSGPTVHPNISDYLVAYSTIPGHVSFRNNKIGSVFILTLVKIFRQHAADEDITTMLERVTDEVSKYQPQGNIYQDNRQCPELRSSLRGQLFLNPCT